ncbi:hypothetical protein LAZ67_11003497 [Cordylochernes scorpioides]|uniref:Reverse transcriptase n=1 Tax=Cordylochernes scorpioides TaxID=51811 RepID=A0ABY6L2K5_9ARAC|nr:hypothetical protein LAZ67_11003497 [Cordylochernes scorpioides]
MEAQTGARVELRTRAERQYFLVHILVPSWSKKFEAIPNMEAFAADSNMSTDTAPYSWSGTLAEVYQPDGIHDQMISNLGKNGKERLVDIFNNSWKIASRLKTATIIPIKKLDKSADDPINYRPISLTSICCKLMEKIILRRLTYHLDTRNLLPEEQYGFRKGHGTIDQLLFFTQKVKDAKNRKPTNHTVATFLDLTQAFDKHACSFRKIQIVKNFWSLWKMAISEPKSAHLREVLLFAFNWKKSATEAHRMLEEVYSDHALNKSQCYRWFKKFQSGDFELDNEPHGKPPQKFEDAELQALLDEDSTQMQEKLANQLQVSQGAVSLRLNSLGMTQKLSKWVPHELSERQQ